ncbi:MAG TPA: hypothetical protein VFM02_04505 [Candidatus Paceibacterota bacterium]|nr:hypothetical protein [Candidatus Paceibacterota bacterium]
MKKFTMGGMMVGAWLGSYIPLLWGAGFLSFSSVLFSAVFGFLGIWFGYRLSKFF